MSAYLTPPDFIPALASTRCPPSDSRPSPRQTLRSPSVCAALGTFAQLVRDPAATISKCFNNTLSVPLSDPTGILNDFAAANDLLRLKLLSATSLDEWRAAAITLDEREGKNIWKAEICSTEYNYELVQSRLEQLENARNGSDSRRMLFLIRTSLTRHLGGMGNTLLYSHSHTGTKYLIEQYISSALATIRSLLDTARNPRNVVLDDREVLQQILKARQSFGRSALLLSGGGTFGMNHIGVVKCLWENRLLPRIISGASAGSIVCAVLCTRTDDEMPAMLKEFCHGDLEVFTRTGVDNSILQQIARFLKTGALFDIANLTRIMKQLLGHLTFQEAYNRTRRILNICVSSAGVFELPRLLNYVTAPNVIIWSAVAASCSVPLIYSPAGLLAKDSKSGEAVPWNPTPQRWIDGSVDNDLPMTRLAEMFNVNHFIVSQVNPHVVPFLALEEGKHALNTTRNDPAIDAGPTWLNLLANLAKDEAMHRMHVLSELGILSTLLTKTRSVLCQKYSGDITILPEISYSQFPKVLKNPTSDFMLQANLHGERATWPKLSRIQNHCAIELALDDAVQQLRALIAFSPSQVDLRLNSMTGAASRAGSDNVNVKLYDSQRKKLRFSAAGITKTRRSISSSESDTQRPSFPPPSDISPTQPSPNHPIAVSFQLQADTPEASYGCEGDGEFLSDSSSAGDDGLDENKEAEQLYPSEQPYAFTSDVPASSKHSDQHIYRPPTPGLRTRISARPAATAPRLSMATNSFSVGTTLASSMSPHIPRVNFPTRSCAGQLHITADNEDTTSLELNDSLKEKSFAPVPDFPACETPIMNHRRHRRRMSTGHRWIRPPGGVL